MRKNRNILNSTIISMIVVIVYLIILWVNKNIIFDISFYYRIWGNKFSIERIDNLVLQNTKFGIISYLLWPCILYIKWILLSLILYIGVLIFEITLLFKNCFKIIILAEFITG